LKLPEEIQKLLVGPEMVKKGINISIKKQKDYLFLLFKAVNYLVWAMIELSV